MRKIYHILYEVSNDKITTKEANGNYWNNLTEEASKIWEHVGMKRNNLATTINLSKSNSLFPRRISTRTVVKAEVTNKTIAYMHSKIFNNNSLTSKKTLN